MTGERPRRKPEVIALDDPDLVVVPEGLALGETADPMRRIGREPRPPDAGEDPLGPRLSSTVERGRSIRWGGLLVGALSLLGGLALALSFARFVSIALERQDWLGWAASALLAIAGISFLVILGREVAGMARLRRLGRSRRELESALSRRDMHAERRAVEAIFASLSTRPELKWVLARLDEHARSVSDPGDLARLVDRDVMPALDGDARRIVAKAARRISVVTALSPMALLTVGWVLAENLRLLRALATLYGGRPGFLATTRLARLVFTHIVATGGIALTDDLLGQFLGQDLVRRLSRRLGESLFNAALTARVGAAAIEVIRPMPYLEAPRVRARDFIAEFVRTTRAADKGKETAGA